MVRVKDVQFYSAHARELKHKQKNKVEQFLKHNCIVYDPNRKIFLCRPIDGYNSTTYELERSKDGFTCSCQFFQQGFKLGERRVCSHIGALYEFLARCHRNRKEENVRQACLTMFEASV